MQTTPSKIAPPPRARASRWLWDRWRNDAFVPGAAHEDGLFLRFAGSHMLAARPWGDPGGAWLLDAREGLRWKPVEPWLDVAGPNLTPPRREPPILPWVAGKTAEPWAQLRLPFPGDTVARAWNERAGSLPAAIAAIPSWAARQVARVEPGFQWRMLRWLELTGPPGAELCEGNPALAVLLAAEGERLGLDARRSIGWRRRRLAGALGLPEREASVRMLAKLRSIRLRPTLAARVADWARDPRALRRVAHAPRIGLAAWMLRDAEELAWLGDGLLTRLLGAEDHAALEALHRFTGLARRFRERGHPVPGPIRTLSRLEREGHDMAERFDQLRDLSGRRRLADPPVPGIPGFVEALRTVADVHEEALTMRHCVLDYLEFALAGRRALYRVLAPERATLCLHPAAHRGWEIYQLRRERNGSPAPATRTVVEAWLSERSAS